MGAGLEALEAEVLRLNRAERAHLLERLVVSLEIQPDIEEAWEIEADNREREIETGHQHYLAGQEAVNRLREQIRP